MKETSEILHNVEIALTLTREDAVEQLLANLKTPTLADCIDKFNWQDFPSYLYATDHFIDRIYFGGEFCERLLPDKKTLLALLGGHAFNFAIHVSSIASCRNSEATKFHHELGAERIIFPRNMKIFEMEKMTIACPELEFESFVLNDGCVFEEGSCHTIHLPGKLGGAICLDNYQSIEQRVDGQSLTQEEQVAFRLNNEHYQSWVWYRFGNGFSMSNNGLPYGPCGLCALPRLAAGGVTSVKIAGRDAPTVRKIKSVEMVAQVR